MLSDAISSEGYKLWRNRNALFWGFVFVPVVALITGIAAIFLTRAAMPEIMRAMPVDMSKLILSAAAQATSPVTILFALIGAAVIFAGDYRWETWRLIAPRNSRINHMTGKAIVFAVAALATVVLVTLMGALSALLGGFVNKAPIQWTDAEFGRWVIVLLSLVVTGWLQLLQMGALVALAVVITRSMIGGIMIPLFVGIIQVLAQSQTPGPQQMDPEWWRIAALPHLAADIVRAHVAGRALTGQQMIPAEVAAKAIASLLGWIVLIFVGALALFRRQDLSKE